jgi:hypothetical protein
MRIARLAFPSIPVLAFACIALSCGSSRRLQSISVSQFTSGTQSTFVATGAFSAPPTAVTPLPVSWYVGAVGAQNTLTTQPFSATTGCLEPAIIPLVAIAPADPNAPSSGSVSGTKMIQSTGADICP